MSQERPDSSNGGSKKSFTILKDFDEDRFASNIDLNERKLRSMKIAKIEQNTKIFASMCPDEILDYYDDYGTREYYTTVMMGDISGFTDLTEKYTKSGKGGPSKLTEILNSYIGAMVQEILSHNGDVLKFSGDAFIVMWKLQKDVLMRDLALEAMQTACIIQKHFGTFDTDVGITLRVKLTIASGKTYFTSIGDPDKMSHYIVTGKPIWDVKHAQNLCRGGDIIVSPSTWQWVNPNEYVYEVLPDRIHILILASSIMWDQAKERYQKENELDDEEEGVADRRSTSQSFISFTTDRIPKPEASLVLMNLTDDILKDYQLKQVDYSLRPKVTKAAKNHLENALRSYILRPIVRSVEMNEPIEYLTEMRQVVIVFINVITTNIDKWKLIYLVNETYKLVCRIVDSMQGCVNKTSLFDKGLMVLCIFGLRGDKHELESQIGLHCAAKVRKTLATLDNTKSVTVGVTTGMTYCGVVGHILRREYTVIGMSVNTAARLMCAYSNKVICDRDTFLYSRLEAGHFILLKPKFLKGITNIGPVYEFHEQIKFQEQDDGTNQLPLLGRDLEIRLFLQMLTNMMKTYKSKDLSNSVNFQQNTLVIRSESRMGKTRLLDEIVRHVPNNISYNHISLTLHDSKSPYSLIHLIFCKPLGFATSSTPKQREDKIVFHLNDIRYSDILCALNETFNVNFAVSSQYKMLRDSEKQKVTRKLLSKLTIRCFGCLWVVVIDDAEYSDDESLPLVSTIIDKNLIFFVMAFGQKLSTNYMLYRGILKKARIINLMGLGKWFHAGLACQILNVKAIPAELEKIIQEKSQGNPGWIESYLVSLTQARGLVMRTVTKEQLGNLGLVVPLSKMLKKCEDNVIQSAVLNVNGSLDRVDGWKMYQSSYKESNANLSEREISHNVVTEKNNENQMISICTVASNFVLEEVDTEVTMDVMILKMFDSLSSIEQLLLKCAAVLGETFSRKMLESLLEETSQREISLAVKKLFEVRVLACAMGDFERSPGPIFFVRHARNPNVDMDIRCGCTGITIDESCADLPIYASCGLMHFKMTMCRDTTYRLLTENQKVEFHNKALKYLQQKTRRCVSCGSGHFIKLLGERYDENNIKERKQWETFNYMMDVVEFGESHDRTRSKKMQSLTSIQDDRRTACLTICRPIEKSPTRTFSSIDFVDCQCNLILVTAYTQILNHCQGIGRKDKMLTAILEFVEVCLSVYNIPHARKLLNDAEEILSQMSNMSDDALVKLPYLTGKIQTLQGKCYLTSGLIVEARNCLYRAIRSLGYSYPTSTIMARIKSTILLKQQKLILRYLRNCKIGVAEGDAANFSEQLASCLAQMFVVFMTKGLQEHARLAAIWGLNAALESNKDFFLLCTAYANMMVIAHKYQYRSIIPLLEKDAINVCCRKKNTVELQELKAVAELYSKIFFSRWFRGETAEATSIGFITVGLCQTIHLVTLKLTMLPRLIHLLMVECRHGEVVSMLHELEFHSNDDMDKSGRTWYYAFCIDMQLETGLTVIPFRKCEQYFQEESETIVNLRDPEAERRYFTCMWLWCVRNDDWEAAMVWKSKAMIAMNILDENSVEASITAMKRLEGLLIYYVHKVNDRNVKAAAISLAEIHNQFKLIGKVRKVIKVIFARYALLRAYYHMIRFHTQTAMRLLHRSKKIAIKMNNKMIYAWADHCEKVWTGSINSIQQDFWKEHCRKSVLDWHDIDTNISKTVPYSLPLPKYSF